MAQGGNFGTSTHLGSFVLATAFINHYGCVDIWVKLASPGDLVVDIELEIGRIQMMPVTTLTELVAYRKEIIQFSTTLSTKWQGAYDHDEENADHGV